MNNVVMEKNPYFVGLQNYATIISDPVFQQAIYNTLYFTVMSVVFHLILGLSFAMLLNTRLLPPLLKAVFRVIYILPWVFTAAIIAILWRLLLDPVGVVNYVLSTLGLITKPVVEVSQPCR